MSIYYHFMRDSGRNGFQKLDINKWIRQKILDYCLHNGYRFDNGDFYTISIHKVVDRIAVWTQTIFFPK